MWVYRCVFVHKHVHLGFLWKKEGSIGFPKAGAKGDYEPPHVNAGLLKEPQALLTTESFL